MEGGPQAPTPTDENANDEAPEMEPRLEPKIYVADLAAYNAGELRGTWLDAAQEPEELRAEIAAMLADSEQPHAEEWAIHDFEDFNGLHLGEWEDLAHVSKVAKGIKEHGPAYAHWATLVTTDEELDEFEGRYIGHWDSVAEYGENVLDDLGLYDEVEKCVSDNLRPYVTLDAAGFARDLQLGGDISVVEGDGGVYIYSNR